MKLLVALLLFLNFKVHSQKISIDNYLYNNAFFNELDEDLLKLNIQENLFKSITEYRFKIDSNLNQSDSTILVRYYFNKSGYLIEKQFDFRDMNTEFVSIKYTYSNDFSSKDSIINDPFDKNILDGILIRQLLSECWKYDDNSPDYSVERIYKSPNEYITVNVHYDESFISEIDVIDNLYVFKHYKHFISYDFIKK